MLSGVIGGIFFSCSRGCDYLLWLWWEGMLNGFFEALNNNQLKKTKVSGSEGSAVGLYTGRNNDGTLCAPLEISI